MYSTSAATTRLPHHIMPAAPFNSVCRQGLHPVWHYMCHASSLQKAESYCSTRAVSRPPWQPPAHEMAAQWSTQAQQQSAALVAATTRLPHHTPCQLHRSSPSAARASILFVTACAGEQSGPQSAEHCSTPVNLAAPMTTPRMSAAIPLVHPDAASSAHSHACSSITSLLAVGTDGQLSLCTHLSVHPCWYF
jgi:hypothetical protein